LLRSLDELGFQSANGLNQPKLSVHFNQYPKKVEILSTYRLYF